MAQGQPWRRSNHGAGAIELQLGTMNVWLYQYNHTIPPFGGYALRGGSVADILP
jgi:hypothetical protein